MYELTVKDTQEIDEQLEAKMAWAESNRVQAEQLAMDATRLLSCTQDRLDAYQKQGFFKRTWGAFKGAHHDTQRANQRDLVDMQKHAWRYINLLNERELLLAHSMITVKNNLLTLQVAEAETREEIQRMAEKVYDRFIALEDRMKRVEAATAIHSWLLTLDTLDYDERYSPHFRLLRLVNDFFSLKSEEWNPQELRYLQKAVKEADLAWKQPLSLNEFVNGLIDEIDQYGYEHYEILLDFPNHDRIPAPFVLEHIAVPAYTSLFSIAQNYTHSTDTISALVENLNCTESEAIKRVLMTFIQRNGVNLEAKVPLRDLAIELLSCMSMAFNLYEKMIQKKQLTEENENNLNVSTEINEEKFFNTSIPINESEKKYSNNEKNINKNSENKIELSEILTINKNESKTFLDKKIKIKTKTIKCEGELTFENCLIEIENADFQIVLEEGSELKMLNCSLFSVERNDYLISCGSYFSF